MELKRIKEIAYKAWVSAANAYKMYPENKHTFGDYWRVAEKEYEIIILLSSKIKEIEKYIASCHSDIGFMGSKEYSEKIDELRELKRKLETL